MLLILVVLIGSGVVVGLAYSFNAGREAGDETCKKLNTFLLSYLFPLLCMLTGRQFELGSTQAKVSGLMVVAMTLSLALAFGVSKLLGKDKLIRNGFILLATCTNTGHGLMLLASSTTDPAILELAMGPLYIGFLWVITVPQLITEKEKFSITDTLRTILRNPISYGCIVGILWGLDFKTPVYIIYLIGIGLAIRLTKNPQPYDKYGSLFTVVWGLAVCEIVIRGRPDIFPKVENMYPLVLIFVTAITLGLKMRHRLEWGHWKIVLAINLFGLILAPGLGLSLAWLTSSSYNEAYVLAYMLSQPPAYLAMLWLRSDKFGDLSISEWAFIVQAMLAYLWASMFADSPLLTYLGFQ